MDLPGHERVVAGLAGISRVVGKFVFVPGGDPVEASFPSGVVDLDVAAVALRRPGRVAGVTFHRAHVLIDGAHGHKGLRRQRLLFLEKLQWLQHKILPACRVDDDLIAFPCHIRKRIPAGGD